ncbi:unnamed protein product [Prorocentrum cordatum]|uniref:Uncharacterized protein n=1 Tax=Prorocentrum cordatum TaxID=2364126 RepID=A0ABN9XBW1_9DINO|nr:unnamed protein product [Polarella glacialis]
MEGGPPSLLATLVTALSATLGACWSWGCWTQAPVAPLLVPPSSSSCGAEEACHCSCDRELRRIIDLQAEVWALRCLLLVGPLVLGLATPAAGALGFLTGACRRCRYGSRGRATADAMADVLTLDVADPQVLVRYENDPHGFYWHHRVLLFRVSEDIWICLTQGQLLGVGQVDAIERMIWVVAGPRSDRFGEVIDAAIKGDENRGMGFVRNGVAVPGGEEFFVQKKIAASSLSDLQRDARADFGDVRTLGDHLDEAGQRCLRLSEAAAMMRDTEQPNFPLAGVRSVIEFLDSVASGPGNVTSYQAEWGRLSGVGEGSAVNHVHRNLCEVIRLMHSWDQVDLSVVAAAELLRWVLQNVARRVEAIGACPTDLAEESSLAAILGSRDHCSMGPENLASFDYDKIKILRGRVHVRPIRRELPPAALGYLRRASDLIEKDEAELEGTFGSGCVSA